MRFSCTHYYYYYCAVRVLNCVHRLLTRRSGRTDVRFVSLWNPLEPYQYIIIMLLITLYYDTIRTLVHVNVRFKDDGDRSSNNNNINACVKCGFKWIFVCAHSCAATDSRATHSFGRREARWKSLVVLETAYYYKASLCCVLYNISSIVRVKMRKKKKNLFST